MAKKRGPNTIGPDPDDCDVTLVEDTGASQLSDPDFLDELGRRYHSESLSPVGRLRRIADFKGDNRFRIFALTLARKFAEQRLLKELDTVFDKPNAIELDKKNSWVRNTRALTENATRISERVTEVLVRHVHPELTEDEDLATEVWAVIKPALDELQERRRAEAIKRQLAQSAVAQLPGIHTGPVGPIGGPIIGPNQPRQPGHKKP